MLIRLASTYTERREDFKKNGVAVILVEDYHEDLILAGIDTAKKLGDAVRHGRKTWEWFPKPYQIIKSYREIVDTNRYQQTQKAIEHKLTQEQVENNKKKIRLLAKVITKEITLEEAEVMMENLIDGEQT